jgi:hypothetical protein
VLHSPAWLAPLLVAAQAWAQEVGGGGGANAGGLVSFPWGTFTATGLLGWYLYYNVRFAGPRREQHVLTLAKTIEAGHQQQIETLTVAHERAVALLTASHEKAVGLLTARK